MQTSNFKLEVNYIKDNVLNKILIVVLLVLLLGVIISTLRIPQTGFLPIYGIHFTLSLLVFIIFLFKNKVEPRIKGGIFMGALYLMALSGLASWGLYGFGYVYFVPATAIAFLYFNKKIGWTLTIVSIISILGLLYLHQKEILYFKPESDEYMQSFQMWLNMIITITLVSYIITFFWTNIFDSLIQTLKHEFQNQGEMQILNEELIQSRDQAEESDRLKSLFLTNMSHEIRTPLNAVIGFTNMLADAKDEKERDELIEIIKQNNDLLLKMITDIVDSSKIETNNLKLKYAKFQLMDLINDISDVFVSSDRIEFVVDAETVDMYTDRDRLFQVILNLINNAFKFTKQGTIMLHASQEGNQVILSVSDTGIGMDKATVDKIFDRFYQADQFTQGTGLGLAISQSIVEKLGGTFTVESEPGKGSIFTFTVIANVFEKERRKN